MHRLFPKIGHPLGRGSLLIRVSLLVQFLLVDLVVSHCLECRELVALNFEVGVCKHQALLHGQVSDGSWHEQVGQLDLKELEVLLDEENCAIH